MDKFVKYDGNKIRYDLITPEFLNGLAEVLSFGANKYAPDNWKKASSNSSNEAFNKYYSALMRHLEAIRKGELIDSDSGLPHIDHVACNVMFLKYFLEE